ncbi:MAG: ankyrin repeat protein [Edafosvirus sp.]|uniref:Ankyrin repeat protein n=1 Tax=Edafosvirus sp. TaxID=2487765 RepID=A0A3G4ZVH0_9VIRU|nr:MAG: ankyrin repeat protein [Edafosvirus sp.]
MDNPISKPSTSTNPKSFTSNPRTFPPTTRTFTTGKIHMPERKVDESLITGLFAVAREGDTYKIKEYISNNNISPAVRNENGETVLHIILQNSSLDGNEKYDLIDFLIKHGANVGAFDKNNITALHLATKYQLKKVVQLLLDHGANPSALDNQFMNPYHYMAMGKIGKCKTVKKVKALIPKAGIQKNPTKQVKDLTAVILDILYQEPFNMYIKNIKNSVGQIDAMFGPETDEAFETYRINVVNILTDQNTNHEDKIRKINEKTIDNKGSLENIIVGKLKDAINPLDIRNNQMDGWGPDDKQINKILPNPTPDDISMNITKNRAELLGKVIGKNLPEIAEKINSEIIKIIEYISGTYNRLNNILQLNTNAGINIDPSVSIDPDILRKLYLHPEATTTPLLHVEIERNDDGVDVRTLIYAPDSEMPSIRRGTKKQLEEWKKTSIRVEPTVLTDDSKSTTGAIHGPNAQREITRQKATAPPTVTDMPLEHPFEYRSRTGNAYRYYILTKFNYYINQIQYYSNIITANINAISDHHFQKNYSYKTYNKILSIIVICLIDICQNLLFAKKEISLISKHLKIINNQIYTKFNLFPHSNYKFLIEQEQINIDSAIEDTNTVLIYINNVYKYSYDLMNELNSLIEFINKESAAFFIIAYNNNFVDLKNNFKKKTMDELTHLFDRPFQQLNLIPTTLEDYSKSFNTNMDLILMKKQLYEKYVPQIHKKNYLTYYTHQIGNVLPNKMPGINTKIRNLNNNEENDTDTYDWGIDRNGKIIEKIPKIGYLLKDISNSPKLKYESTGIRNLLANADDTKIGYLGLKNGITDKKKTEALPIVSSYIDQHLNIIKYRIIQHIIIIFKEVSDPTGIVTTPLSPFIVDSIKNIKTKINDLLENKYDIGSADIESVLYTIVGKIADELIINFIKDNAKKTAGIKTIDILKQIDIKKDYSDILNPAKINILGPDNGFKLHLNEVFDDITNRYLTDDPNILNELHGLSYTLPLVENQKDIKKQFEMYNDNYNITNAIVVEQCLKMNPEIITMLSQSRGNINQKDISGSSPIFYALEMQHSEAVQKFIENGAYVSSEAMKNKAGFTPLTYAISLYKTHLYEIRIWRRL